MRNLSRECDDKKRMLRTPPGKSILSLEFSR